MNNVGIKYFLEDKDHRRWSKRGPPKEDQHLLKTKKSFNDSLLKGYKLRNQIRAPCGSNSEFRD